MEIIILFPIFIFGIVIGSFLNVCICRLPDHENIVTKRSHCVSCGNILKWYELIPIISYLLQRGKCRHCQSRISIQYPAVELINGLLYLWIVTVKGYSPVSVLFCLGASALLVIAVIDVKTFEIPPGCNLFIGLLGIISMLMDLEHWYSYLIGMMLVSGIFYAVYLLTRGKGIGGGDIKLMAAAGLLLGWQNILLALVIASIAGAVIHLTLMKLSGKERMLAFGPYLSAGILLAMLYGDKIIAWYLSVCFMR